MFSQCSKEKRSLGKIVMQLPQLSAYRTQIFTTRHVSNERQARVVFELRTQKQGNETVSHAIEAIYQGYLSTPVTSHEIVHPLLSVGGKKQEKGLGQCATSISWLSEGGGRGVACKA